MEGCGYRDLQSEFDALGVEIIAVGFDSPAANQAWAEDQSYLYEIWSDDDKTLALAFGAAASASQSFPGGVTVILDENGDVWLGYNVGADIPTHPAEVLEDCERLFGG